MQSTARTHRERSFPFHAGRQIEPVDELHHQKMAHVGFVGIVRHDDVRMPQCGDRFHFPLKPFHKERVLREILGQHLQRNDPLHAAMAGFVHRAHAASTSRSSTS